LLASKLAYSSHAGEPCGLPALIFHDGLQHLVEATNLSLLLLDTLLLFVHYLFMLHELCRLFLFADIVNPD
jgi:hypothetical protein